uniref:Uncharacterized protein n=1 Tax=Astyanax mexicanus TaxID=7994 RepID=A0A3B1IPV6_ASTMX
MDHSITASLEDELQCSICLDVLTDPVSTPCGHNFCSASVVHHFQRRQSCSRPAVPCDVCSGRKRPAVKSCLDCLMDPVENLQDYICQNHERPLELFCRDDQTCVCRFCTETDHKTHSTVPVEQESGEKKEKADSVEVFRALVRCIERSQAELLEVIEEEQKAAERQAEELIKELEQEITELKRRDTELEQISHTEDHLHLLQVRVPLFLNSNAVQHRTALPMLRGFSSLLLYLDVTLDPNTAYAKLILSADRKQVWHGLTPQNVPNFPERFYYEVQVRDKSSWVLGLARESVNRKGMISVSPDDGFWTIHLRNTTKYLALDSPPVLLSLNQVLQKVGVFVDYEEGLVSFYDVETSSHIYSFTGQSFTEKIYPFFFPCNKGESSRPMTICTFRRRI